MESKDTRILREKYPDYIKQVDENYRKNFLLIILDSSFFTFSMTLLSVDTIIPYFVSKLTSSSIWIGIFSSLFILGFTLPQIIGAYLANIIHSRKRLVFIIALIERVGILLIAIISQFVGKLSNNYLLILFTIAFTIFAFTNGLIGPAYSDLISKNIHKHRGVFYGFSNVVSGLIGFLGSMTVKILLEKNNFPLNIQNIFWICFFSSFVSPFFIAKFHEVEFPIQRKKEQLIAFIKKAFTSTIADKNFVKYMSIRALIGFSEMGYAFYAIHIIRKFDMPIGNLGYYSMIALVTASILGIVWGVIGDRFGFKIVYIFITLQIIFQSATILLINRTWVLFLVAFLVGATYSAKSVADSNTLFEIAPPAETSKYIGVDNTVLAPFYSIAPIFAGLLVDRFTYKSLFQTATLFGIFSFLIVLFFFKDPRKTH